MARDVGEREKQDDDDKRLGNAHEREEIAAHHIFEIRREYERRSHKHEHEIPYATERQPPFEGDDPCEQRQGNDYLARMLGDDSHRAG